MPSLTGLLNVLRRAKEDESSPDAMCCQKPVTKSSRIQILQPGSTVGQDLVAGKTGLAWSRPPHLGKKEGAPKLFERVPSARAKGLGHQTLMALSHNSKSMTCTPAPVQTVWLSTAHVRRAASLVWWLWPESSFSAMFLACLFLSPASLFRIAFTSCIRLHCPQ